MTPTIMTFFKRSAILHGKWLLCVFEPPLQGVGATYDDHLRFIGKHVVDFLLVLTELSSLGVTAEVLRASIGSKSVISLIWGRLTQNFQVIGVTPTNHSSSQKTMDRRTNFLATIPHCIQCSTVKRMTTAMITMTMITTTDNSNKTAF